MNSTNRSVSKSAPKKAASVTAAFDNMFKDTPLDKNLHKMMRCTISKAKDIDVGGGIVGRVWPCVVHFVKPSRLL